MSTIDPLAGEAELFTAALSLDPVRREELASALLQSLEDLPSRQNKSPQQWDDEITRRIKSSMDADSSGVGFDEAVESIRKAGQGG
jgi:hypothetical protein